MNMTTETKEKVRLIMECPQHQELSNMIGDVKIKVDRLYNIEVTNGKTEIMEAPEILKDIWEATRFQRDRKKIFVIMGKYEKTWYVIRRIIVFIAGGIVAIHFFKFQFADLVKWVFKF